MVWPCKQNTSEKASITSFTWESKRGKRTRWEDYLELLPQQPSRTWAGSEKRQKGLVVAVVLSYPFRAMEA